MKAFTGVAVALTLLLVPSTALGQTELPVGEAHGVRVVREHRAIVIVFTARADKLHKRLAGKNVIVSCTEITEDGFSSGSQVMRVPRHGHKLYTGDLTRGMDYCRLWKPRTKHRSKQVIVSVPLTQQGAVFIDEELKTRRMFGVLGIAYFVGESKHLDGVPTYDELIHGVPKQARAGLARSVVSLAAPGDSPPAGKVGYYSDGAEHVVVAIVSASGRRLFVENGPDDLFSSNVLRFLINEPI